MPKTVGAEALSMQDNAFCVSVTPTEEKSFYDDDFCLSVYVLTYVWEVFYNQKLLSAKRTLRHSLKNL